MSATTGSPSSRSARSSPEHFLDYYADRVDDRQVASALDLRSARILLALRGAPGGLRLSDLASLTRIPLSSAQRLMGGLERDGLVVREGSYHPKYRLAPEAPAAAIEEVARWRLPTSDIAEVERFLDDALSASLLQGASDDVSIDLPAVVLDTRRTVLAILRRRAQPGAGSDLQHLMNGERPLMSWWAAADVALKGIPHAAIGAVAAMRYMPARGTNDLDMAVRLADLPKAEAALRAAGWRSTTTLQLAGGLAGKAWVDSSGNELDLMGLPGRWGAAAISTATHDPASKMRAVTLPYSVVTKMISSRAKDISDLSRMLGSPSDAETAPVLALIKQHMESSLDDLEQIIALGRAEAGRSG